MQRTVLGFSGSAASAAAIGWLRERSGREIVTVTVDIGDTAKTYPIITIPTGITAITLSHSNTGKSFTLSGTHASSIIVNCATLQITQAGSNAVSFLTSSPNFGIYHVGSGTLTLSSSNVTGTGTVSVEMTPRYER